jgi:hypothetical protein
MAKKKQPAKKRRHPNIKKAVADIEKLQKAHKQMALNLEKTKAALLRTPFTPFQ